MKEKRAKRFSPPDLKRANPSSIRSRFSKNFSFWKVSLIYYAMFKIKLLQYKDLILNS